MSVSYQVGDNPKMDEMEDRVRRLLQMSTCFGCDRDGQPNICTSSPCVCAREIAEAVLDVQESK